MLLKDTRGGVTLLKESELIKEINQYVTTNISEFSHEQIIEISNPETVADLKKQVIIEVRGENSLLQNQQEIIAVLTNYQHNFEKNNPYMQVYQAYIVTESHRIRLCLNFFLKFIYQYEQFSKIEIRDALMKQGVDATGSILANWKKIEIQRLSQNLTARVSPLPQSRPVESYVPRPGQLIDTANPLIQTIIENVEKLRQQVLAIDTQLSTADNLDETLERQLQSKQTELDNIAAMIDSFTKEKESLESHYTTVATKLNQLEPKMKQVQETSQLLQNKFNQNHTVDLEKIKQQYKQLELYTTELEKKQKQQHYIEEKINQIEQLNERTKGLVAKFENKIVESSNQTEKAVAFLEKEKQLLANFALVERNLASKTEAFDYEKKELTLFIQQLKHENHLLKDQLQQANGSSQPAVEPIFDNVHESLPQKVEFVDVKEEDQVSLDLINDQKVVQTKSLIKESISEERDIYLSRSRKIDNAKKLTKPKLTLKEYNDIYQKVRYLEHTWMIYLDYLVRLESDPDAFHLSQLTPSEQRLKKRINRHLIEEFIRSNQISTMKEEIELRKRNFFKNPKINLTAKKYRELLQVVENYEVMDYLNQVLRKIYETTK
ncbi:hypothetical protein IV74_GL000291 [Carnobacterium divergens DSM 20623]|uniref:Uncharacterized protein n=1 Tax=Carnobacterium divergens DSM 20623 TaxID=1449336 RepID=A0A0R2HY44_CARDV|nr:hypothetical protein IV74_GL000291 [Carnobacterium divergens DSM 20623]